MRVKNLLLLVVVGLGVALLSGCGGGGAGTMLATRSPFAGIWDGTTTDPVTGEVGTMTLTIAENGAVSGTETIGTDPNPIPINGTIDPGGSLNCQGHPAGRPASGVSGTFILDPRGELVALDGSGTGRPAHRRHIRLHRRGSGAQPPPPSGA